MNLDSLFQQIFLVEQKAEEKRCLMHQVKQDISKNHEKANQITQQLGEQKQKLEIEKNLKTKIAEEDETFLKEIKNFNNEYGLILNRELVIKKRAQTEIGELDEKESLLRKEIESMEHETIQLKIFHLQKNELKQDLSTLQRKLTDFEKEIAETKSITNCLELEKITISEKLQTNSEYIRLKKQLENYKEDEMENACEALQMEIEFLQMELLQKKSSAK
ncbi:coiled-coil domain-containing protein 172 isoform X4 [Pantherophis guttatus]|uniref:Coiled-coil domain-containing protein 172 n=1 Tax=Pantherophis guttatus TaxID=94885 RepID=A0A6P9DYR5_PANGU|nr:coiled-coil domain-containing protein 172 isoform X4 [Pantherophis guttatus]